jgi:hypothetical protein
MAVCKSHKQGIVKAQLQTNLDTKHQELVPRTRRNIVSAVRQNTSLQPWAMEEDDVIDPGPTSTPLPTQVFGYGMPPHSKTKLLPA